MVGVDRGVHVLAALSDGRLLANAAVGGKRKAATARMQRELDAATVRDGKRRVINGREYRRVKARKRLARAKEREGNARRDYAHKVARQLVNGADVIALEKLSLRATTRSARGSVESPGCNVRAKRIPRGESPILLCRKPLVPRRAGGVGPLVPHSAGDRHLTCPVISCFAFSPTGFRPNTWVTSMARVSVCSTARTLPRRRDSGPWTSAGTMRT